MTTKPVYIETNFQGGIVLPLSVPASPVAGSTYLNSGILHTYDGSSWINGDSRYANITGDTFTGLLTTVATATGTAGFRLPHGTAPTSPVDGDTWTTTAGLYTRINGTTVGPLGTGGGGGVTDHGALTGLSDDDHTQYALSAGDTFTGAVTFNTAVTASTVPTAGGHLTNKTYVDSVAGSYAETISSGTTVVITHSLGTLDVHVTVYRISDGVEVDVPYSHTSTNSITLNSAVSLAGHRVVVIPSGGTAGAVPTGLPTGGTTGQILTKASATSYDTVWSTHLQQNNVPSTMWFGFWPYYHSTTYTLAGNQARLMRVYLQQAITDVTIEVSTAGSTTVAITLYADAGTVPGSLVATSGTLDVSTTGYKTASMTASAGWYWVGTHNLSNTTVVLRGLIGHNPYSSGMTAQSTLATLQGQGWNYNITGTPPSTVSSPASQNNTCTAIYLKAA